MPEHKEVQIVAEQVLNQSLPNGTILQMVEIQYQALGMPIRRVYINLSEDTPEKRAELIREDLERAGVSRPTLLQL